jgi:hypothetical protein
MAHKSKSKHQGPSPVRVHYSAQQTSTTKNDGAATIEKAKEIETLVAPVFSFPSSSVYPQELEISDSEDVLGITAETSVQTTAKTQ